MPVDMSKQVPMVTLNDGVEMPLLGFGTSGVQNAASGDQVKTDPAYKAIIHAIKCGYRFFDTAALYQNEELVGLAVNDAINEGLVERRDLFICTKVWSTAHKRKSVMMACRDSLNKLRLDYVDLYLIHWPCAYADFYERPEPRPADKFINPRHEGTGKLEYSSTHFTETWLGMQDVRDAKLARSIGLSNFNHKMIDEIYAMDGFKYTPSVNQVELHPYLSQTKLAEYSRSKSIVLNAYCPLGAPGASWLPPNQPNVIEDPLIGKLAGKYGKSPAQIILKYHLKRGISPIPKSATPSRIEENIQLFDFELADEDLKQMLALDKGMRYCINTAGELIGDHPNYPFHEEF